MNITPAPTYDALSRGRIRHAVHPDIVNPWAVCPADIKIMGRERKRDKDRVELPQHVERLLSITAYNDRLECHMATQRTVVFRQGRQEIYAPVTLSYDEQDLEGFDFCQAFVDLKARYGDHVGPQEPPAFKCLNDRPASQKAKEHLWHVTAGNEVVNPETGEITIAPERTPYAAGDRKLADVANGLGRGPKLSRAFLVSVGMLHSEVEMKTVHMLTDPNQSRPEYSDRLRVSEWAVKMGHAKQTKSGNGRGLDWVTATGMAYIDAMVQLEISFAEPRGTKVKAIDQIRALLVIEPNMRQVDIVKRTGLSKMTVSDNYRKLVSGSTDFHPSAL